MIIGCLHAVEIHIGPITFINMNFKEIINGTSGVSRKCYMSISIVFLELGKISQTRHLVAKMPNHAIFMDKLPADCAAKTHTHFSCHANGADGAAVCYTNAHQVHVHSPERTA